MIVCGAKFTIANLLMEIQFANSMLQIFHSHQAVYALQNCESNISVGVRNGPIMPCVAIQCQRNSAVFDNQMFLQIWRCSNEQNWDCMMSPFTERCESTQSEIHTCNKGDCVTHILNRLCKSDLALTTTGRGRGLQKSHSCPMDHWTSK